MPIKKRYPNPWHKDDPVRFSIVLRRWILDFPWNKVSKETNRLLVNGKLTMRCPNCKAINIAGPWCPKCGRMVHFDNWVQQAAKDPKTSKGRRSKETVMQMFEK